MVQDIVDTYGVTPGMEEDYCTLIIATKQKMQTDVAEFDCVEELARYSGQVH